jgi:hypothetical protein
MPVLKSRLLELERLLLPPPPPPPAPAPPPALPAGAGRGPGPETLALVLGDLQRAGCLRDGPLAPLAEWSAAERATFRRVLGEQGLAHLFADE